MDWSNEQILEFISLYEKYPLLWNPKIPDHKNRNRLYDAWMNIQREFSPEIPISELKKKKESLMATYRALRRKVIESRATGTSQGSGDVYKPVWFAYDALDRFLRTKGKWNPTVSYENVNAPETEVFPSPEDKDDSRNQEDAQQFSENVLFQPSTSAKNNIDDDLVMKDGLMEPCCGHTSLYEAVRSLQEISKQTKVSNEFQIFAQHVAVQLEQLSLEDALVLQSDIQNLITNRRLELIRKEKTKLSPDISTEFNH